ncbi:RsmB/NOP family class I SAM-dependent RNA methyltransferase [Lapidilactobacillus luobeiensis]|uniref:RsmB/NOP family class I SAM-dependent RNA methyltransferase n=1 Tax=Lapidilactobacillus luobeiensis TaxID=2950371 RepID=UPI0021C2F582|nr:RsmF rRNA methyltransferase first C-terminal domain-containing protein [Lapidilactobacillus luobeiensis]
MPSLSLPNAFREKYRCLLGPVEGTAFLASFDQPAVKGFRFNPKKMTTRSPEIVDLKAKATAIPWSLLGYYGQVKGTAIAQTSGAIYSQEPSAQAVAAFADPRPGSRVLDLCAAPGGKTTQLAGILGETGLLVANEIDRQRAKILSENVERFGYSNVVVTNHEPQRLAQLFPNFFDMIVVDAPCSGEGMFRKDPDAIQYWQADYPLACQQRQRQILTEALKMLAPEGTLVYSTCTFAPEEDEENIAWLLTKEPTMRLVAPNSATWAQVDRGRPEWGQDRPEMTQTLRFWPQHLRGEGHFLAKLQRTMPAPAIKSQVVKRTDTPLTAPERRHPQQRRQERSTGLQPLSKNEGAIWLDFCRQNKISLPDFFEKLQLQHDQQQLFAIPKELPALSGVHYVRRGLWLGELRKNRFVPNQALVMALPSAAFAVTIELDQADYQRFRHGETVDLPATTLAKGWYPVATQGLIFSWGYLVGNTVKNFYPKNLRTR